MKPECPFHDMLESELVSLDKDPKGIQWPLQQELSPDDDLVGVGQEKKVRQKFVGFHWFFYLHNWIYPTICTCCYVIML